MDLKKLLNLTSILEFSLGIALLLIPSLIIHLIFGIESSESLNTIGRLSGIIYISLGIGCWQGSGNNEYKINLPAVSGMFTYNLLIAIFFYFLKFVSGYDGVILLPAAILHSLITILFIIFLKKIK